MDVSLATKGLFASNCTPKYKNWIGEIKMSKQTLNINEKAGWNALAKETNTKAFVREMGREPHDYEEVKAWVNAYVEAAIAASDSEPEKPEPTLGVENGEMYWVTNFWKVEVTV